MKIGYFEDFPKFRKVFMIPEGMDVDEVKHVKHDPVEPKRILYVGALRCYKNVDKILEGFAHLIKRGDTQYRLVIVGGGAEYASLVNLAHNLGISSLWNGNMAYLDSNCCVNMRKQAFSFSFRLWKVSAGLFMKHC
jgi:glycosyltransferase involved in cell wall biosynthesis